jgi:hypothetical protein
VFYMVLMFWMCDGGILDDWMGLALSYVPSLMMLMWWGDACCLGVIS